MLPPSGIGRAGQHRHHRRRAV